MTLPDSLYAEIEKLSENGNVFYDSGAFDGAIAVWMRALDLVPEPKSDWESATWLNASIGDAYYQLNRFREAKAFFFDALNCPGGPANPLIHLRLGESMTRLGETDRAIEHLTKAYALGGAELFAKDKDGEHFLAMLSRRGLV